MSGDAATGICIMQMEAGLDTGPVLLRRETPIGETETTDQLHDRLSTMGAECIVEALSALNTLTPEVQPEEGVTYASKIDKAEAAVDWAKSAIEISRQIRGLATFPGAWTTHKGERIKLLGAELAEGQGDAGTVIGPALTVACAEGAVRITKAQRAGKGAQDIDTFLRGWPIETGEKLGSE